MSFFSWLPSIVLALGFLPLFITSSVMGAAMNSIDSSNDTSLLHDASQLHLAWSQTGTNSMQNFLSALVEPLTLAAGLNRPMADLKKINVSGSLVLVTMNNAANIAAPNVAYLNCENGAWGNGLMNATAMFATVLGQNPAGIILYSTESNHCNYTMNGQVSTSSAFIYSMIGKDNSTRLESALKMTGSTLGQAIISSSTMAPTQQSSNGSDGPSSNAAQNVLGPSPTTAVAMIILYSITGVITGLFLIIIITGAVRAHRHPERYGPRHGALGRPRQSRAKGIARAMLETIPIVKFGEHDSSPMPKPSGGDVELGEAGTATDGQRAETTSVEHKEMSKGAAPTTLPEAVSTPSNLEQETSPRIATGAQEPTTDTHGKAKATESKAIVAAPTAVGIASAAAVAIQQDAAKQEEGLGCSICTEDFVKGEDVRLLPCNHQYHPECIDPWLLNVSGTCPLCRIDLRPDAGTDSTTLAPTTNDALAATIARATAVETAQEEDTHRQRGRVIASYLEQHLGITLQSRPEERIAALRRLREENRGGSGGRSTSDGGENRRRNRLSGLLRGRRRSSRVDSSTSAGGTAASAADGIDTTMTGAGPTPSSSALASNVAHTAESGAIAPVSNGVSTTGEGAAGSNARTLNL